MVVQRRIINSCGYAANRSLSLVLPLTVCLQQLLLGGDGERAVFGWQHHSQAHIMLLRGVGPTDDGQQPHRVGLRGCAEPLHAEPSGVTQAWWGRKQALAWVRKGGVRKDRGLFVFIHIYIYIYFLKIHNYFYLNALHIKSIHNRWVHIVGQTDRPLPSQHLQFFRKATEVFPATGDT